MRYSPLVAACLLIGAGVFFLQTHHNRGPFWYGYDEEGKGRQVVEGFRNLNHPLLNVNVAALVYHQMDPGPQPIQQAVVVGRICAAAGVGLAAMSLAWLAWRRAGALAGGLVGLAMAVHPAFIHAAHFFKEDGLLVGTWGLLLLALDGFLCRPGVWTSGLAGVAAGLCASAKYVGFFPAVLGLGLLVRGSPGGARWTQLGRVWVYLMAATAVWVGINHALIADGGRALSRIQVEVDMLFHETTTAGPAWQLLGRTSGWSGLLGLLIYVILRARQPQAWPRIEVFGMLTATLYVFGYFMLERSAERYFLPFWLVEWWLTAVGFGLWWRALPGLSRWRWPGLVWLTVLVLTYAPMTQRGLLRHQSYAQPNSRLIMAQYIDQHLPADALVVYDATVNLPDAGRMQRQVNGFAPRQRLRELTPDLVTGTNILESLKALGVTHVVMSTRRMSFFNQPDYLKIFHRDPHAGLRRHFHEELQQEAEVLFTAPAGPDPFISPSLLLYIL